MSQQDKPFATVHLTESQFQALAGLIDAGVRHLGLRAASEAGHLADLLENSRNDKGVNVVSMEPEKDAS